MLTNVHGEDVLVLVFYCRKCGTRLPTDGSFCPTCGTLQTGNDYTPTHLPQQEPSLIGTGRLPPGRILHQRYRLLHTVGQGGMGAVYVAQDSQLGDRLVAVKEMSMRRLMPQELPLAIEQFRREAHLLASLQHPNLPVIHEYFNEQDRWYLVMNFIEGQNLQTVLDAAPGKKLPVKEVVRIGIELCEVLDYLHTHEPPIIFRDLKPSNIMVTPKGHICLIDFGIARHFKQEQTKDTAYYYSVGYAPPEQYGQSQTGPRSDIYNLGATLHQMLSGHHPASRPFQFSHLQLVAPTIPVPLANLITQMLEMNEQNRPASVAEVKAQLARVFTSEPLGPSRKVVDEKEEQARLAQAEWERKAAAERARLAEAERLKKAAEQARLAEAERERKAAEERARLAEVERVKKAAEQARLAEAQGTERTAEPSTSAASLTRDRSTTYRRIRNRSAILTFNMFLNVWGLLTILGILHFSWGTILEAIAVLVVLLLPLYFLRLLLFSFIRAIYSLFTLSVSIGWGIAGWILGPTVLQRIPIPSLYLALGFAVICFLISIMENMLVGFPLVRRLY